jgi:hypothetical protein
VGLSLKSPRFLSNRWGPPHVDDPCRSWKKRQDQRGEITTPAIIGLANGALMVATLLLIRPYLFANGITSGWLSPFRGGWPTRLRCTAIRINNGGRAIAAKRINLPSYIFVAEATSTPVAGGPNVILGESKFPDGVELDGSTRRTLDAWACDESTPESIAPTLKMAKLGWSVVPRLDRPAYGSRLPSGGASSMRRGVTRESTATCFRKMCDDGDSAAPDISQPAGEMNAMRRSMVTFSTPWSMPYGGSISSPWPDVWTS